MGIDKDMHISKPAQLPFIYLTDTNERACLRFEFSFDLTQLTDKAKQ